MKPAKIKRTSVSYAYVFIFSDVTGVHVLLFTIQNT